MRAFSIKSLNLTCGVLCALFFLATSFFMSDVCNYLLELFALLVLINCMKFQLNFLILLGFAKRLTNFRCCCRICCQRRLTNLHKIWCSLNERTWCRHGLLTWVGKNQTLWCIFGGYDRDYSQSDQSIVSNNNNIYV